MSPPKLLPRDILVINSPSATSPSAAKPAPRPQPVDVAVGSPMAIPVSEGDAAPLPFYFGYTTPTPRTLQQRMEQRKLRVQEELMRGLRRQQAEDATAALRVDDKEERDK